jgi:hypothetical protein
MRIVMEGIVFDGARRCLIIKLFWMKSSLKSFHNIGSASGLSLEGGSMLNNRHVDYLF